MSRHESKIDIRYLNGQGGYPFAGNLSVRCVWNKTTRRQYVCECVASEPAPQSSGDSNE
ncbi:MAG: hypothetical protein KAQ85_00235 [Thermodesulfovibrionia bacterium]|nr:hypothetical protein [Thermodesulfovibrionia bacterium]